MKKETDLPEEKKQAVKQRFNGDTDWTELESTDLFCPGCGTKSVLVEANEGDFYQGPTHYCTSCKYSFTMPSGGVDHRLVFRN